MVILDYFLFSVPEVPTIIEIHPYYSDSDIDNKRLLRLTVYFNTTVSLRRLTCTQSHFHQWDLLCSNLFKYLMELTGQLIPTL